MTEKTAKNFHLAAITNDGQLTLLFQVKPGPINKSFGIQVAEIAQLPAGVLLDAKNHLKEIESEQQKGDCLNPNELKVAELLERIKNGADFDLSMIEKF